jgi:CubicO group peptidase (beta-lactamase class C family)
MINQKTCLIALLLLAAVAHAQPTTSEKIDEHLTRLTGFGLTGQVLVAQDGKVILEKGYGFADRNRKLPFTKDTVVDIGSNTKDLTKTAILQLAQSGKLKLTDTLPKFFDHVPADKAVITIEQLMEHTAGFGQHSGRDEEPLTKADFLQRVFAAPLLAPPGQKERYSNPGYSLLAAIIEKISGNSYEQYVQAQILKPAGMTTTGYILPKWRDGQLARNYAEGREEPPTFEYPHLPDGPGWNLRGNGGTLSTVGDMYKFYQALQGDKLLAPEFKAKLFDVNAPLMLAGSNGIHFFVYQNEPANRLVILVATTDPRVRAPEVSRRIVAIVNGRELPLNAPNAAAAATANTNAPTLPDNAAGRLVAAYLKAFNSGDEKAMQAFLQTHLAPASLASRPMDERLKIYQRLRGDLGDLTVGNVAATNETGLAVTFQTATGKTAEFTFELDPVEPQKLKGLRIELRE